MKVTAGKDAFGAAVEVRGFSETMYALSAVDPDLQKSFVRDFRQFGSMIANKAKGKVQSRSGAMLKGYRTRLRTRKGITKVQVYNDTPQGMILEFAGSTSGGKTKQGQSLINTLNAKYGKTGRFMWEAYDELKPRIDLMVQMAISEVERALDDRLKGTT